MFLNTTSGFETIHGILDLIMTKIGASFSKDYRIQESDDAMFFPKRGANVNFAGQIIGKIGVLHPEVLANYHIKYPVSCLEINIEVLFDHFRNKQH